MKHDTAPLSAYHLHPNSTIALIGTDAPPPSSQPPQTSQIRAEQPVIETIRAELSNVRTTLAPALVIFLQDPNLSGRKEHLRLGELLLQSLIRLDAIVPESTWDHARKDRKEAVREVQDMLDRLDNAWSSRVE